MTQARQIPAALTIAGSDSGGGAGIQADLKTFASLGVHGTSAITCITAQNPRRVLGVEACSAAILRRQLDAVCEELKPSAVKTGMLFSAELIGVVADFFKGGHAPIVVDPVMVSTSGARLLQEGAVRVLCERLLPLAALATPNLLEAEVLVGRKLGAPEDLRAAARELQGRFGCAVLVKGGHLRGSREALDLFYDGREELLLSAPFVRGVSTHGTGCTYSAAITACLARGLSLSAAVGQSKEYITQAIAQSVRSNRHWVLNSFWEGSRSASLLPKRKY